jgi:putative FmdB family regulatory protein
MPPLYSYYCADCDKNKLEMRLMAERLQKPLPSCDRCGKEMTFEISGPPMAIVKNPAAGGRP